MLSDLFGLRGTSEHIRSDNVPSKTVRALVNCKSQWGSTALVAVVTVCWWLPPVKGPLSPIANIGSIVVALTVLET